jgi:hypothetical protein
LLASTLCLAEEPNTKPVSDETVVNANQNIGKWGKAVSGLRCRIETDKQVYKVGEKISIALTWQNVSDNELGLFFSDDDIAYRLLSVRRGDGSVPLGRLIMIKNSPKNKPIIESQGIYARNLTATLLKEYLKEAWLLKHQKKSGNLIMKFDGKLLGEFPILLDKPGNFYLSFNYFLPSDSFLAKKEPNIWTGDIASEEVMIKVVEDKQ